MKVIERNQEGNKMSLELSENKDTTHQTTGYNEGNSKWDS